jgi:diaminopimelate dehydrogenase
MVEKYRIRMAIVGGGNIGKACRDIIAQNKESYEDMELVGVISRDSKRASKDFPETEICPFDDPTTWLNINADVALLCGGSKNDLFGDEKKVQEILKDKDLVTKLVNSRGSELLQLGQGPYFAQYFPTTLDTFDTHPRISDYHNILDAVARPRGNLAVLSTGWDPGTFSEMRIAFDSYAIGDKPAPFYGLKPEGGKSMGHSNALLTIKGVKKGIQYTHAVPELIEMARRGEHLPEAKTVTREAIIVLENDTPEERARVKKETLEMDGYYKGYKTSVEFVDNVTYDTKHANAKQHDGVVIATGKTGPYFARHEFACQYGSNSHGTAGIMVASARGAYKLKQEGKVGACILADIPVSYRSGRSRAQLLKFM